MGIYPTIFSGYLYRSSNIQIDVITGVCAIVLRTSYQISLSLDSQDFPLSRVLVSLFFVVNIFNVAFNGFNPYYANFRRFNE